MSGSPTAATSVGPSEKQGLLKALGPGLITGAADDDPSGIATYSQAGAQFGYGLGWVLVLTMPMMIVIQIVAAQIGRVTGVGIAANLRRHYSRKMLWAVVCLLLAANIINLGADLGAMGDALALFIGGNRALYTLIFGVVCVLLEVFVNYARYAKILKWTTLSLFSYVAVVVVAGVDWPNALRSLVLPDLMWDKGYATTMVAILGTTISPYLFFWQAGQEIEEGHRRHTKPLCITPKESGPELKRIRNDTLVGMTFSNLVAIAIVFATAATLHARGITSITTSAQAAEALRPIAGEFAFALFGLGIIGTGMLAVPILAGSAAYAVTELVGVAGSLDSKLLKAKFFYFFIAVTVLCGSLLGFVGLDPVKALYWAAVVNGVLAVPLMAAMMLIVRNPRAMGRLTLSKRMTTLGWLATLLMFIASVVFFFFLFAA